jgi:isopenicillin N synthase-like dioxygenase
MELPVVDLGAADAAKAIGSACRAHGFFYVSGHGVDPAVARRLDETSRAFFALPDEVKARWAMKHGGRAWRGWFPLGGELTSGRPDWKEGLYLGTDLPADHPRVVAGVPLHGANLIPDVVPGFGAAIAEYMHAVVNVGHRVLEKVADSLGVAPGYFAERYTATPLVLFRIFHYPSRSAPEEVRHGVGEHTDYGLLTLLRQDDVGGLSVRTARGWIDAPPIPDTFVCNIGDMLDRMTGGFYKSTPHAVKLNTSGRDRLSFPLFFDPDWDAVISPIRTPSIDERMADARERWDGASVHAFEGTYGEYVMAKVGKVFPELRKAIESAER